MYEYIFLIFFLSECSAFWSENAFGFRLNQPFMYLGHTRTNKATPYTITSDSRTRGNYDKKKRQFEPGTAPLIVHEMTSWNVLNIFTSFGYYLSLDVDG